MVPLAFKPDGYIIVIDVLNRVKVLVKKQVMLFDNCVILACNLLKLLLIGTEVFHKREVLRPVNFELD